MEEMVLELAQMGLLRAARILDRKGTAKAKKLAKTLRAAHAALDEYLNEA